MLFQEITNQLKVSTTNEIGTKVHFYSMAW
jgi:hypothetical protein